MVDKVKIDIVSDVVCPWCAIGYKRLERAMEEMGMADRFEIEWQPFELNPEMPTEGEQVDEHIARKYGASPEEQKASEDRMVAYGEQLGFRFDYFEKMKMVNTRDAHVLLEYAREEGKQTDLKLRLLASFFGERKDVSDRDILLQELKSVGLDEDQARARLSDGAARTRVLEKEGYWKSLGISSVPTVVFNMKSALTGAQPVEVYKQVLSELLKEHPQET